MIVIFCDNSVLNLYWICTTDGAKDLVLKKCSISGDHQFHIFHFADQTLLPNLPTTYPLITKTFILRKQEQIHHRPYDQIFTQLTASYVFLWKVLEQCLKV